ncbi:MAG: class I SAM-dependent methyltransferase, partial [Oscillospiraceae bacterium]
MNTKSDDCFNPKRDHAYFQEIWEYKQPNGFQHSVELWDKRADVWAKELAHDGSFRQDVDDRVARVAAYLRGHGLLGPRSSVIDIGCGPGRFVVEFAKTAERAQGLDLSPRMAEIAGEYAQSVGVKNASFFFGDFKKMNVEEQGLKKQFDLVFTSITPAISTVESLRKLMEMSCGHCFNSCCIEWWDELEEKVAQQVFAQQNKPRPYWGRRWFYSLFNFLWLEGYFP